MGQLPSTCRLYQAASRGARQLSLSTRSMVSSSWSIVLAKRASLADVTEFFHLILCVCSSDKD